VRCVRDDASFQVMWRDATNAPRDREAGGEVGRSESSLDEARRCGSTSLRSGQDRRQGDGRRKTKAKTRAGSLAMLLPSRRDSLRHEPRSRDIGKYLLPAFICSLSIVDKTVSKQFSFDRKKRISDVKGEQMIEKYKVLVFYNALIALILFLFSLPFLLTLS